MPPVDGTTSVELALLAVVGLVGVAVAFVLGRRRGKGTRYALWTTLAVVVGIIAIVTLVIPGTSDYPGGRYANLTPGQEIERGLDNPGSASWFNLVGNIAMFIPLGLVVAALIPGGFWRRLVLATGTGVVLTGGIEFLQFGMGRVADIDDIILNSVGALVGAFVGATAASIVTAVRSRQRT
ncbi:VanZ family protein [Demequina globuliformis]|uniref:VanZ family protein n=1 Tax=Demequina globuliformis TaxID=676202 RepID=UPI0007805A19|nr:VanZ family protein [Demequina globuliformis]